MSWQSCRLGDVLTLKRGHDLPEHSRQDGNIPVVSSSGITGRHKEAKAKAPGVVTGRYGTIGEVFYLEEDYWPLNTALYVIDFKGNDPRFSAYFLRNVLKDYQSEKAAVPGVDRNVLHEIKVRAPDHVEQLRIVGVLSVYDDLIENNRRRMALLEESARLLYREWFVRLRFPGYEHTRITDGVPEGWERLPFSQLAGFVNGYPFKPAELGVVGLPIVKIPELRDGVSDKTPRNEGENIPEKYLLNDGDLLFSWSGTLLIEFWYDGPAILNQHLFRVEPQSQYSRAFLLFALREALPEFSNQTVGATMKHIRKAALTTVTVCIPSHSLLVQFDELAADVFEQVLNLRRQNQKLRAARDLLLPRLMSGEIVV